MLKQQVGDGHHGESDERHPAEIGLHGGGQDGTNSGKGSESEACGEQILSPVLPGPERDPVVGGAGLEYLAMDRIDEAEEGLGLDGARLVVREAKQEDCCARDGGESAPIAKYKGNEKHGPDGGRMVEEGNCNQDCARVAMAGGECAERCDHQRDGESARDGFELRCDDGGAVDESTQPEECTSQDACSQRQATRAGQPEGTPVTQPAEHELLSEEHLFEAEAERAVQCETDFVVDGVAEVRAGENEVAIKEPRIAEVFKERDVDLRVAQQKAVTGEYEQAKGGECGEDRAQGKTLPPLHFSGVFSNWVLAQTRLGLSSSALASDLRASVFLPDLRSAMPLQRWASANLALIDRALSKSSMAFSTPPPKEGGK